MQQSFAYMKGGRIYTLEPRRPDGPNDPMKWARYTGYCDGQRCGAFRTKKDFENFVDMEPEAAKPGPHAQASFDAERDSTFDGCILIHRFLRGQALRGLDPAKYRERYTELQNAAMMRTLTKAEADQFAALTETLFNVRG